MNIDAVKQASIDYHNALARYEHAGKEKDDARRLLETAAGLAYRSGVDLDPVLDRFGVRSALHSFLDGALRGLNYP